MAAVTDATPRLKFRVHVEWSAEDQNVADVIVGNALKIAELFWNGAEWLFVPWGKDGLIYSADDMRHIDVDPERRLHLNRIEEANTLDRLDRNETVQAAMDAALMTRRREFRDDTRELAEMGAKIFARGWYPKWRDL